ncbi:MULTISPECIES: thermonuclease family protein [unclassified Sinorhizobium]|uniref:thermonuclease family protein n=1 Tax=unclassified Sinorhizobium TaxID=2613772 RepID=UPI0024C28888|nr:MULTISPECIES: thermonuclease family protein [unclassified Sinorhizobium]MDK1373150.1 thermonuclease family protein [Sinorhizobium sp. 6-70]MDK1482892.1 thermonuclease family protein [Sinorhizobium sp. 6-117]
MRSGRRRFRILSGAGASPPQPRRRFGFSRSGTVEPKRGSGMTGGWIFLILLSIGAYVAAQLPPPERTVTGELQGAATASDGDSLRLDGRRIRLEGIDAPEIGQTCRRGGATWDCGGEARQYLKTLTSGLTTACRLHGHDRYGRDLGVCEAGQRDVGREMVLSGYAVSYGRYQNEEEAAREGGVGVWSGDFVRPQAWRRSNGGAEETPHEADNWSGLILQWIEEQGRVIFKRLVNGGQ